MKISRLYTLREMERRLDSFVKNLEEKNLPEVNYNEKRLFVNLMRAGIILKERS